MLNLSSRRALVSVSLVLLVASSIRAAEPSQNAAGSGPNLRVVEVDEITTRLDMAVKFFAPATGRGPTVALVSAIHVGDASFYDFAQKFLDSQDLVLFEGVGPGHTPDLATPQGRVAVTSDRIRQIAILVERHKAAKNEYPAALGDLLKAAGDNRIRRDRLTRALSDAWKKPLAYEKFAAGFTLASNGADGKPGGEGENADLAYADQPALTKDEIEDKSGIQNDLAEALGLTFQLNAVDTGKPNFRNADISMAKLEERLAGAGSESGELLKMLDGSSSMAGLVKMGLGMIKSNPRMQATFKVVIMDMLVAVGDDISRMRNLPASMRDMMKVLIEERNQVVIDSLKAEIGKDKPAATIALWYGAGHMKDLEARLGDQLQYRHVASFWLPAITLDLSGGSVKKSDIQGMRTMMKGMMEAVKPK